MDDKIQTLRRRVKGGDSLVRVQLLREQARVGDLTDRQLTVMAYCGDRDALAVSSLAASVEASDHIDGICNCPGCADFNMDDREWIDFMGKVVGENVRQQTLAFVFRRGDPAITLRDAFKMLVSEAMAADRPELFR